MSHFGLTRNPCLTIVKTTAWIAPKPEMLTIPKYEDWVFKLQDIRIVIRRDDVDADKCPGVKDLDKIPDDCPVSSLYRKCSEELNIHSDSIVVMDGRANPVPFNSHLTMGQLRNTYCH